MAPRRVRAACPGEAIQYKQACRAWREARCRHLAIESEATWREYVSEVAYYSRIAQLRRGGLEHVYQGRLYRYIADELLPRSEVRQRALIRMREADAATGESRDRIFAASGVSTALRDL